MAKRNAMPSWCPRCHRDGQASNIACEECIRSYYEDLDRRQAIKPGCNGSELRFFTELNIGFVSVVETDEHMERLRRADEEVEAGHARSKISKTNAANISAVNRVAARVVKK